MTAQKKPHTGLLLADAERILRAILEGTGELGLYGDIRDWLKAAEKVKR